MKTNPVEDLKEIRKMMEGSSKFISLSGLSGIAAGIIALTGTYLAYVQIKHFETMWVSNYLSGTSRMAEWDLIVNLFITAVIVLILAIAAGFLFTYLNARKKNYQLSNSLTWKLIKSLMTPLIFGGLFILVAINHGMVGLVVPACLLFYGMALLNASKYVHIELSYLAILEMILGILSFATIKYTYDGVITMLIYWAIGFGVLHIIYGILIYYKYNRNESL